MEKQSVRVEANADKVANNRKPVTEYKAGQPEQKEVDKKVKTQSEMQSNGKQIVQPKNDGQKAQLSPEQVSGVKLSMAVDPEDSPVGPEPTVYKTDLKTNTVKNYQDVDEGIGITPEAFRKQVPKVSHSEADKVVAIEPVEVPVIEEQEENSLIHEGDSLVKQLDDPNSKHPKPSTAMTVVDGGPQRAPAKKKSHKTTFDVVGYEVKGNTKLLSNVNAEDNPLQIKQNLMLVIQGQQTYLQPKLPDASVRDPSLTYPGGASSYIVQHHGTAGQPMPSMDLQKGETSSPAHLNVQSISVSMQRNENLVLMVENPGPLSPVMVPSYSQTGHMEVPHPHYPSQPRPEDLKSPSTPMSPQPQPQQAPVLPEFDDVHNLSAELNGSNVANLDDSLRDEPVVQPKTKPQGQSDSQSKYQNNFDKYVKDEAGMSVFAPADIDYSDRANRAEAHLMQYDTDIRARYEKVARGMQQVYSNIQKINVGAHDSANRFKVFINGLMNKADKLIALYPLPTGLSVMVERKDMQELRPAGNIRDLQRTFETFHAQRAEQASQVQAELREMRQEYQSKIVEENFYEEGIDQKSTVEMQKTIEKGFDSIFKRNKQCIEQYGSINKKIEDNKAYFEKKKKFKNDTFEDYMSYLRSVRKLWMFIADNHDKLVKYWERVRVMEELRIKAITHILQRYFLIEEKLSSRSQNTEALKRMNSQLSPEGMAGVIYNDKSFLNSPLLESIGIKLDSIEVFTAEIRKLKNTVPEIVEFALWDYTNLNTLVKSVNTPLRIFRSNENTLYVYSQVKDRSEVPMEGPLFKCKVNSLLLHFDERNNCIQLKGSGFFDFSNFTFHLREHQDAKEFEAIVNKFCKNSKESS